MRQNPATRKTVKSFLSQKTDKCPGEQAGKHDKMADTIVEEMGTEELVTKGDFHQYSCLFKRRTKINRKH